MFNIFSSYWYQKPNLVGELTSTARQILHKNNLTSFRYIAIGQTASWLVKAIQLVLDSSNLPNDISTYIPHVINHCSDQDFHNGKDGSRVMLFYEPVRALSQLDYLKAYLTSQQLDPASIIDSYIQSNTKICLISHIGRMDHLASFVHVLYRWAQVWSESNPFITVAGIDKDSLTVWLDAVDIRMWSNSNISHKYLSFPEDKIVFTLYHSQISPELEQAIKSDETNHGHFVAYLREGMWESDPVFRMTENSKAFAAIQQSCRHSHVQLSK